jgi:hypothetical protein
MFKNPYIEHLAFQPKNYPLVMGEFENYEALYSNLSLLNYISIDIFNIDANEVVFELNSIIDNLLSQTSIDRERLFLEDLLKQSNRILKEDIEVFRKRLIQKLNKQKFINFEKTKHDFKKFKQQKFILGNISKDSVHEINQIIAPSIDVFRKNAENGLTRREDLSVNNGEAISKVVKILNKEFKKQGILDLISEYRGEKSVVSGCAIELSVTKANWWKVTYPEYQAQPKTLYYHFDESVGVPKAIVYLNEVGLKNGFTSCIPNLVENLKLSHLQFLIGRTIACVGRSADIDLSKYYNHKYHNTFGCELFRRDFSLLPKEMKFGSHFGWDVVPESDLETFIIDNEHKVVGAEGSFIVFDGGLLPHRGGMVNEGERIALQIIFDKETSLKDKIIDFVSKNLNYA